METRLKSAVAVAALAVAGQALAQVTFYENENYQGRSFTTERQVGDLQRVGFNDRASSVVVQDERWEACEDIRFGGRCVVLRPGQYGSLTSMGLSGRIASVRAVERDQRVDDRRYAPAPTASQIVVYDRPGFEGRSLTVVNPLEDFARSGFNDRAASAVVFGDQWELCEDSRFNGRCVTLRPGRYPTLASVGMADRLSSARAVNRDADLVGQRDAPPTPPPQVIFYEREGFEGRSFAADAQLDDFARSGFNDRATSVVVMGGRWEACSDAGFRGRCVILRPGRYTSLAAMGMNNSISSVRMVRRDVEVDNTRYAPPPLPVYDNRRRNEERLYEVKITSVRAVVGPDQQRCWLEQAPVTQNRGDANVGGAVVGAIIGGILGHQVGGGIGKDIATAGGAIAGGVIGSNVGRDGNGQQVQSQNVQRCETTTSQAAPAYWDVVYSFRGLEHRIQMTTQPGATITVNEQGEPRA